LPGKWLRPLAKWKFIKMSDRWSMSKQLLCWLILAAICGCNKTPAGGGSSAETGEVSEQDAQTTSKRIIPIRRDVKELDGNWVMVVTQQGRDHYIWLCNFKKDAAGKIEVKLTDAGQMAPLEPKLDLAEVTAKTVHLQVTNKSAVLDFVGEFEGGAIRGTLSPGNGEVYAARLLPADASKLADYVTDALPPAADVYMTTIKKMGNQPEPKAILQIAREYRTSPLSLDTIFGLLSLSSRAGFDDPTVLEIINQYIELSKVWGPRMQAQAELLTAQQLVTTGRLTTEAIKHLDEAEKLAGEGNTAIKSRVQVFREQAEITLALAKSRSKSDEERAAANTELLPALKKQPYNAEILVALGDYAAAHDERDAAINYYSSVVALPLLEQFVLARRAGQPPGDPTPSDLLRKLWSDEHGNEDGLQEHLEKVYSETLTQLRDELRGKGPAVPPVDSGDHTILVEFFTGAQMPPAIATEIAMDAVRETYPTSQVITLRYHQHIPGPDGLVNQDSEDRLASYEQGRVPLVALDGALLNPDQVPYSGFMQASATAYSIFRTVIDARLKQSTPIRIQLSGKVENDELMVEASATGMKEEDLPSLRLRLVLAEESVDAVLPNGMRHHAMVVREMPGGARGVAVKKGELKFSLSMPVGELQQRLDEYLSRYETGNKIQLPATAKPAIRGPLYLIGMVQNDKLNPSRPDFGRAILQSAIVPVTGFSAATPEKETTEPAATPTEKAAPAAVVAPAEASPPAPALPME
jgi:hypothetical protein